MIWSVDVTQPLSILYVLNFPYCPRTRAEQIVKTVDTLQVFLLAMLMYPDVQKKAQSCLDEVLRGERLPLYSDLTAVPYLTAVINEVMRWQPSVPLG
jgi:hypothetical protein